MYFALHFNDIAPHFYPLLKMHVYYWYSMHVYIRVWISSFFCHRYLFINVWHALWHHLKLYQSSFKRERLELEGQCGQLSATIFALGQYFCGNFFFWCSLKLEALSKFSTVKSGSKLLKIFYEKKKTWLLLISWLNITYDDVHSFTIMCVCTTFNLSLVSMFSQGVFFLKLEWHFTETWIETITKK